MKDIKKLLFGLVKSGKIKTCKELPDENAVIVCTALEDADYKEINKEWKLEGNKSYPRDVNCSECNRQVMMSNELFRMFEEQGKKSKVICGKCVFLKNKLKL